MQISIFQSANSRNKPYIKGLPKRVEVNTIQDLIDLRDLYGHPLILNRDYKTQELVIEIYNWYIE